MQEILKNPYDEFKRNLFIETLITSSHFDVAETSPFFGENISKYKFLYKTCNILFLK